MSKKLLQSLSFLGLLTSPHAMTSHRPSSPRRIRSPRQGRGLSQNGSHRPVHIFPTTFETCSHNPSLIFACSALQSWYFSGSRRQRRRNCTSMGLDCVHDSLGAAGACRHPRPEWIRHFCRREVGPTPHGDYLFQCYHRFRALALSPPSGYTWHVAASKRECVEQCRAAAYS